MSDEKQQIMCPCCGEQHITTLAGLMDKYQKLMEFIKRPAVHDRTVMECMSWILRDANEDLTVHQAMFMHVALAEFYFEVLRADADLLKAGDKEREPHDTILEDLWGAAMDVTKSMQGVTVQELGITLHVPPDLDPDPLDDVLPGWMVKGGDA